MRILALDSALGRCSATLVSDDQVLAYRQQDIDRGQASVLALMARDVLDEAAIETQALDLIGVTVGPGGFTGVRSALALAHGMGISTDVPVIGVTVGEALADSLPLLGGRVLWSAITSRRGRIFLEIGDQILSLATTELPWPHHPVAIAGNAAGDVASRLAARGANVMLTDARLPVGRHIARVAEQRWAGSIRPLPPQPLYVDPPATTPAPGVSRQPSP